MCARGMRAFETEFSTCTLQYTHAFNEASFEGHLSKSGTESFGVYQMVCLSPSPLILRSFFANAMYHLQPFSCFLYYFICPIYKHTERVSSFNSAEGSSTLDKIRHFSSHRCRLSIFHWYLFEEDVVATLHSLCHVHGYERFGISQQ